MSPSMSRLLVVGACLLLLFDRKAAAFMTRRALFGNDVDSRLSQSRLQQTRNDDGSVDGAAKRMSGVEEYRNTATKVLSNFMQAEKEQTDDLLDAIDWEGTPKIPSSTSLQDLAEALDYELTERQWFVTGDVNPVYFSPEFEFQDPDVQLKGIDEYARGVRKLFNQETSQAQIVSTVVNGTDTITCTWRLSGDINIGPGLPIKPYICYTDFTVDPQTSLIVRQEDRFDLPGWDILLSSLFPFLIGRVTAPPAPAVPERNLALPHLLKSRQKPSTAQSPSPFAFLQDMFKAR